MVHEGFGCTFMKGYLGFTTRIRSNQLLVVAGGRIVFFNSFDLFLHWVKDRLFRATAVTHPVGQPHWCLLLSH